MPELIAEEPKNWLQIYVDAVTEKDPYKRLALVQRLRQIPRHDESDEAPERPRLQVAPKPAVPKPPVPPRTVVAPSDALPVRPHVMRRRASSHRGGAGHAGAGSQSGAGDSKKNAAGRKKSTSGPKK